MIRPAAAVVGLCVALAGCAERGTPTASPPAASLTRPSHPEPTDSRRLPLPDVRFYLLTASDLPGRWVPYGGTDATSFPSCLTGFITTDRTMGLKASAAFASGGDSQVRETVSGFRTESDLDALWAAGTQLAATCTDPGFDFKGTRSHGPLAPASVRHAGDQTLGWSISVDVNGATIHAQAVAARRYRELALIFYLDRTEPASVDVNQLVAAAVARLQ